MNRNPLIWTCPECKHKEDILLLNNNYCCSICGYTKSKESISSETIQTINSPQILFQEQLRQLFLSIKDWEKLKDYNLDSSVGDFMNKLTELYLDYYQYHLEEAKSIAKEFINDLFWAVGVIRESFAVPEFHYFSSCYDIDASWNSICRVATEIKIFDDMFSSMTAKINACEFWDFVEGYRNQYIYPDKDKIPKNIPFDHWWWFTEYELNGQSELLI